RLPRRPHNEAADFAADRVDRLLALDLDVAGCILGDPASVLLGSRAKLCPELVGGAAGAFDHLRRSGPGLLKLGLGTMQPVLRLDARPLGSVELFADLPLAPLSRRHHPPAHPPA